MIESFDKDLELAIDKKMVEKQHKLVVDSLKRKRVEVSLGEEINGIAADFFTGVIDRIEVGNRYIESIYLKNKDGNMVELFRDKK